MKRLIVCVFILNVITGYSQKVEDLFQPSDVKISWLGVDFSHVKLVGDFAQFFGAGEQSTFEIRNDYFPTWNRLILRESVKYDLKGMMRKGDIYNDLDMIMKKNAVTPLETLEAYDTPNYSEKDIQAFVKEYNVVNKDGIGIVFIAEVLNKNESEAYFHFVAVNLKNKKVLFHKRLRGKPLGIGLRNYWAGSIHDVMRDIEKVHYKEWKVEVLEKDFSKKGK